MKNVDLMKLALTAAAVAAGIYVVNRFTDGGIASFGRPASK